MKIVIFAGGVGTRLWPLSRKKTPKQFENLVGDKSTLQLMVERLQPVFDPFDFFISTNIQYLAKVKNQLAAVPQDNIIGEPQARDVGPAVGLMTAILNKISPDEPIAILWSDHLVKDENKFRKILKLAEGIVQKDPNKIIFIAQKPRFASQNLGWIEYGDCILKQNGIQIHAFGGFKYRPDKATADKFLKSGKHAWNLGYFVTTPKFLWKKYEQHVPKMHKKLKILQNVWNTGRWDLTLAEIYPTLEKISFDNAILEKLEIKEAGVISEELGWSDIGAWEALKEALQKTENENVTLGKVITQDTKNCLIYNYRQSQLVSTIDLEGMLIVNTSDVLLVCREESVPKIKKMVESFAETENENLT